MNRQEYLDITLRNLRNTLTRALDGDYNSNTIEKEINKLLEAMHELQTV